MKQVYVTNNVGDPLEYDYDLKYEEGKRTCLYSRNSEWAEYLHGQKAGSIKDIDDGFLIKIGDNKIELDYCDMQERAVSHEDPDAMWPLLLLSLPRHRLSPPTHSHGG